MEEVQTILSCLNKFSFRSVDLNFQIIDEPYSEENMDDLCKKNLLINRIIMYDSVNETTIKPIGINEKVRLIKTAKENINVEQVHPDYFYINMSLFTEAQNHNSYYNRKLYIDNKGYINPTAVSTTLFGKYTDTSIDKNLKKKQFTELWYIRKDQLLHCKNCEYRYMCSDNRIPKKNKKNEWEFDKECGYNPYIAKWYFEEEYQTINDFISSNGFVA